MKFNAYLKEHVIQEWRRAYINYRLLKKQIGRCEAELDALDEQQGAEPTGESSAVRTTLRREPDLEQGGGPSGPAPEGPPASPSAIERQVTSPGPSEISRDAPSDAPLRRRTSVASGMSTTSAGLLKRISVRRAASGLTPAGDFNPKKWRKPFTSNMSIAQVVDLCELLPAPHCAKWFTILDRELDRVSKFYEDREAEAVKRFAELSMQWKELADHKKEFQAFRAREMNPPTMLAPVIARVPQIPGSGLVRRTLAQRKTQDQVEAAAQAHMHSDGNGNGNCHTHGRPEEYTAARSKLKLATFEYYRSLGMLKSYRVLNRTGFAKGMKKFEKATKIPCAAAYGAKVDRADFVSSDKLDELIRETEDAFASVFEHGDRKKALERLRDFGARKNHHFSVWRSGLMLGAAMPLLLEGIVKSAQASTRAEIPYWQPLLQIFGGMFLPILFTLLFQLNLLAWSAARINHVLIFELDVRTRLDTRQFVEIPALLFFIFSLYFWLAFSNFWPDEIAPSAYPMAFFVSAMIILLMPFQFFYPSARWWMVRSFSRVITAGLVRVEFRDFFVGDELNSLYWSMTQLGLLVCAYNHSWAPDTGSVCSTNSTWVTPAIACLPAAWRLGQSLRRYLDSDGLLIHMLNAGKYSATVAQLWFYYSWRIHGSDETWRKVLWIIFSVINSSYTASWDIYMDWSLLRKNSKHPLLRSELGFFKERPWMYYVAIVYDILLRFAWVWYLAPAPSVSLRGFLLALIEVFRRIVWNAFRVESEHIGNVDGYRVTRNVPLPYTTTPSGGAATADDDVLEDSPGSFKARAFAFFHNLHRGLAKDFAPLGSIHLLVLGRGTGPKAEARRAREKELRRQKRSRKTGGDTSDEEDQDDDVDVADEAMDGEEDDYEVDGGHPREGAHERAERKQEEEEDENEEDDSDDGDIDEIIRAVGDADRMMETSAEGVRATAGMDRAELALRSDDKRS